jgi:hypothetical protein
MDKGKAMNKKILRLLFRSFDAAMTEKEQRCLDEALEDSEELRKEKERILVQRQAIVDSAFFSFGPHFPERVMGKISALGFKKRTGLESFYETFKLTFQRLAMASALILLLLVSYNLIKGDILPQDEILFASDSVVAEILDVPLF